MEWWFQDQSLFSVMVNGQKAESVWMQCLARYRENSLPSTVTGALTHLDLTPLPFDVVSSSQHDVPATETKPDREDDDIDALLSSAGTFVRDRRTSVSSLIGLHSAVSSGSQSSHGQQDSSLVDGTSNVLGSVNTTDVVDQEEGAASAAASEPLSSPYASPKGSASRSKFSRHSTGQSDTLW